MVSIAIHDTNSRGRLRAGNIAIDSIWVKDGTNRETVLEDFDSVSDWTVLRGARESITDNLQSISASVDNPTVRDAAQFIWSEGPPLTGRGIYHGPPPSPLPVLASRSFLSGTGHSIGEEFTVSISGHRVPIRIIDSFEYFPTLNTVGRRYLVSDIASVIRYTNLEPTSAEIKPNEMWLSTASNGSERQSLVEEMRSEGEPFQSRAVHDQVEELDQAAVDPLVQAGWRALLFMAFGAVLILSCLGFLVHSYVSFREREMQFGLMRTVGFSMRQLITLVWLEQAIVIGGGNGARCGDGTTAWGNNHAVPEPQRPGDGGAATVCTGDRLGHTGNHLWVHDCGVHGDNPGHDLVHTQDFASEDIEARRTLEVCLVRHINLYLVVRQLTLYGSTNRIKGLRL